MWLLGSRLLSRGSECSEVLSRLLSPHFVSRMCQSTSEALDFLQRTAEEGPASTPSEHGDPDSQELLGGVSWGGAGPGAHTVGLLGQVLQPVLGYRL